VRNLVFVHGRGQQGREADALRRRWAAGLNKGLTAAGRDPLGTGEIDAIEFPFYGDVLWAEVVQARAAVPDVAALDAVQQVDPGLPDAVNRRQVAVLNAMAGELGLPAAVAPAAALAMPTSALLRGVLEWVANHSGVDEAVIRGFLRDVSAYLDLPGCRPAVQAVVRPALLAEAGGVVVGHSLGGVVCAELPGALHRAPPGPPRRRHRHRRPPGLASERLVVPLPVGAAEQAGRVSSTYRSVMSATWSASAKRRPPSVFRTMPSKTSSSGTSRTCSTVPISSPPAAWTGTPLGSAW
jgi:hypothetical protein